MNYLPMEHSREDELNIIIIELHGKIEKLKSELISKFLKRIRHIPLFWATFSDELQQVYEEIDKIRDFYQKELLRYLKS